ncbi:hypothetical protein PVPAM_000020000 [Plasmodium vivax]|nr:hypothetical protein PVPAM_000020000 [Plasmodium vivax]
MIFSCTSPEKDKNDNEFYLECAHRTFETFHQNFDRVKDEYLDYIKKINDAILRHISLYFVQYYIDGYHYYHNSELVEINGACQYLNRWLEERKDLFTYGEQCPTKKESWDNAINALWDMLKKDYPTSKKDGKPWCDKSTIKLTTKYPLELTSLKCDETISPETKSEELSLQSFDTNCKCPPSEVPVIPLFQFKPQKRIELRILLLLQVLQQLEHLEPYFFYIGLPQ